MVSSVSIVRESPVVHFFKLLVLVIATELSIRVEIAVLSLERHIFALVWYILKIKDSLNLNVLLLETLLFGRLSFTEIVLQDFVLLTLDHILEQFFAHDVVRVVRVIFVHQVNFVICHELVEMSEVALTDIRVFRS